MAYQGNLETYLSQHPALLPEYWLEVARVFDEMNPPMTTKLLPEKTIPRRVFKWRVHIDPADMAPMVQTEISKTRFATSKTVKELFECKGIKTGFYVTEDELDEGLPGTVQTLTTERINSINRRVEYINIRCLQGFTWNVSAFTGRQVLMTRPTWQASGGTPIRDVLYMTLRVWKRSGKIPTYLIIGPNEHFYMQNHATLLAQMGTGANNILCNDMINCIKNLTVLRVDGFYKEDAWDWANNPMNPAATGTPSVPQQPGRGDMAMDLEATPNKRWMLQDRAIVTTGQVGYTFVRRGLRSRQWEDPDTGNIYWKFEKMITPVVEDWGRIGLITFTGTTYTATGEPSTI